MYSDQGDVEGHYRDAFDVTQREVRGMRGTVQPVASE
jgi:hypothetical protein